MIFDTKSKLFSQDITIFSNDKQTADGHNKNINKQLWHPNVNKQLTQGSFKCKQTAEVKKKIKGNQTAK